MAEHVDLVGMVAWVSTLVAIGPFVMDHRGVSRDGDAAVEERIARLVVR